MSQSQRLQEAVHQSVVLIENCREDGCHDDDGQHRRQVKHKPVPASSHQGLPSEDRRDKDGTANGHNRHYDEDKQCVLKRPDESGIVDEGGEVV